MSERLYRAVSARAVVALVCADKPDRPRESPGEVIACAPYIRKLVMGLSEPLAVELLERRGFTVERL